MVLWFLGRTTTCSLHSHLPVLHPLFGQPGRRHRAAGLSWGHGCWCSYDAEAKHIFSRAFIVCYKLTHCISLTQAERDNLLFDATFSHLETSQVWTGNLSWKTQFLPPHPSCPQGSLSIQITHCSSPDPTTVCMKRTGDLQVLPHCRQALSNGKQGVS